MSGHRILAWLVVAGLLLASAAGCGSKVTKSNYDKVKTGMTLAEVEKILGKGTEQAGIGGALEGLTGSAKVLTWEDGEKVITITFVNDKVTTKVQKGL
jgi:hypothetical protein